MLATITARHAPQYTGIFECIDVQAFAAVLFSSGVAHLFYVTTDTGRSFRFRWRAVAYLVLFVYQPFVLVVLDHQNPIIACITYAFITVLLVRELRVRHVQARHVESV